MNSVEPGCGLSRQCSEILQSGHLSGLCVSCVPTSSGPQNCAACVYEGLYEEGISILESSSVSTQC